MKNIVLVTSALFTKYGIYNPDQRIQQTIATVKSARKYIPDSTIILIDNSTVEIQSSTNSGLSELEDLVDFWIDNSDDTDIKYFHDNVSNYDIGKNMMECLGMYKAFTHILTDDAFKDVATSNRIYKLSGRYEVTDKFDLSTFDNENTKGKYVFKTAQPAWIDSGVTGVTHLLQTRLWSFDSSLLAETKNLFAHILKNMTEVIKQGKYIDIEHSMAKFVPADKLVQINIVGLKGNIAPNGMVVID